MARGFRVVGRVQGVGFRWWTRRKAEELGVAGTVRNRPDGSVEIHATADAATLDRFEAALATGPLGARVDAVDRFEGAAGLGTDFRILV